MQISRYTAAWICFLTFSLLPSGAADWQIVDVASVMYYDIAAGPASDLYAVGESGPRARLRRSLDSGKTWQDSPAQPTGVLTSFNRVAVDPQGQVFVLRTFGSGNFVTVYQIWRSTAGSAGADLSLAHAFDSSYSMRDIAADSAGNVFVLGSQSLTNWVVLKGKWKGTAMDWAEVDKVNRVGTDTLTPTDMAIRLAPPGGKDELWTVCRRYNSADNSYTVLMRRSLDGGTTWSPAGQMDQTTFRPGRIAIAPDGAVYVTGQNPGIAGETYRSVNGGNTWLQVDAFAPEYRGRAMAVTPSGEAYTIMADATGAGLPVIRSSPNGDPGTWQDRSGTGWSAEGLAADSKGNVFAIGSDGTNGIIAKLSAPQLPALELNRSGSDLRIAWPLSATGYVLQRATTLSGQGDWQDVPEPPVSENEQNVYIISNGVSSGFFRLKKAP